MFIPYVSWRTKKKLYSFCQAVFKSVYLRKFYLSLYEWSVSFRTEITTYYSALEAFGHRDINYSFKRYQDRHGLMRAVQWIRFSSEPIEAKVKGDDPLERRCSSGRRWPRSRLVKGFQDGCRQRRSSRTPLSSVSIRERRASDLC